MVTKKKGRLGCQEKKKKQRKHRSPTCVSNMKKLGDARGRDPAILDDRGKVVPMTKSECPPKNKNEKRTLP